MGPEARTRPEIIPLQMLLVWFAQRRATPTGLHSPWLDESSGPTRATLVGIRTSAILGEEQVHNRDEKTLVNEG